MKREWSLNPQARLESRAQKHTARKQMHAEKH